jgi:glucose/mannose-6-phosphate isomerase
MVNRHYRLPEFVDETTLLIASSYSGDTEETISALKDGLKRKARIMGIASGGELVRQAKKHSFPLIQIPGGFSPRAALGFSVIPLLAALSKLGFKEAYRVQELKEAQLLIQNLAESHYGVQVPLERNQAKKLAEFCFKKQVFIYSGVDYFDVVALRWRGQIEENAKAIASHHVLPEMNHNELVGWSNPQDLLKESVVFFLRDEADYDRIRMRIDLSREIIESKANQVIDVKSQGKGLLARMFSLIYLGDWLSFYLAMLYGVDPTPVEVIQYLKSELAKEPMG